MVDHVDDYGNVEQRLRDRIVVGDAVFMMVAFALEVGTIVSASIFTGVLYHLVAYGDPGVLSDFVTVGGWVALLYTLPFIFRNEYNPSDFLEGRRGVDRLFLVWNYAILCLAVIGFVTKTTEDFSRGWLLLFYFCGLLSLIGLDALLEWIVHVLVRAHRLAVRRLMLVGGEEEVARISVELSRARTGARVAATIAIPYHSDASVPASARPLGDILAGAVSRARALDIDDVVILTDWSREALIHQVVEAFRAVPVSIHLGASNVVGSFRDAHVSRFSALTTLSLTAQPLGPMQAMAKRTFDVVVAATALILLSPLFAVVAGMIKATSPGPVFFRQRRRGYNQEEFRIWKFRTMVTMDDGGHIEQAKPNDDRVTPIGTVLRRWSIDELPQLINVLTGDMSLVGPRPHAVAHDELFEQRIATYQRRLNVRPGMTGWAQVHGQRGATETDAAMQKRVEYDLFYIDNWSLALDLYILVLTVLSPRTYRNAH